MLFFIGIAVIIWSDQNLAANVRQELFALAGLIIASIGALLAAYSYILLSLVRILTFLWKDK